MRKSRLGCLSWTGILAMLITVLAISGVVYAKGGLLYSPGPLNAQTGEMLGGVTSHAETDGDCNACHTAPWAAATMADRCVVCHGEIASQMKGMVALHGAIYQNNSKLECRNCHPEHRGANAPLTAMESAQFPHELLGYSLNGHNLTSKNEPFVCSDCHTESISTFATDTCQTCHGQIDAAFTQAHVLSYGTACLNCHDGVDKLGKNFNHNSLSFPLQGKHANVLCASCHLDARSLADFRATPQDCFACHQADDPHEQRFGKDCAACHSPDGWEPANFDHNLSAFKLEGRHAKVACKDCHLNSVYQGTPTDCYSCHQNEDEHHGEFGTDCASCHTPNDWGEVKVDHNLFRFKLEGSHARVACIDCHQNGDFRNTPTDCYSCHRNDDEHRGAYGAQCEACHAPTNWEDATFDHNRSNFPLTGSHTNLDCSQCHENGQFAGLSTACVSCHADPVYHAGMFSTNCAECHSTVNWFATYTGPHPSFGDEGGGTNHEGATCRDCHPSNLREYTCLVCHNSNNPGDGEGGGGDRGGDD